MIDLGWCQTMFFFARFNNALATLGIDPNYITDELRRAARTSGEVDGATPQEAALMLASNLPFAFRMQLHRTTAVGWIEKRKVDVCKPDIRAALSRLSWAELADR